MCQSAPTNGSSSSAAFVPAIGKSVDMANKSAGDIQENIENPQLYQWLVPKPVPLLIHWGYSEQNHPKIILIILRGFGAVLLSSFLYLQALHCSNTFFFFFFPETLLIGREVDCCWAQVHRSSCLRQPFCSFFLKKVSRCWWDSLRLKPWCWQARVLNIFCNKNGRQHKLAVIKNNTFLLHKGELLKKV